VKGCWKTKGKWTDWTAWNECLEPYTNPCGEGRRTRTRDCVGEGVHYKFHCDGEKVEYDCPDANCEAITTTGKWTDWTAWSECSKPYIKPCGKGISLRTRMCLGDRVNTSHTYDINCEGEYAEYLSN